MEKLHVQSAVTPMESGDFNAMVWLGKNTAIHNKFDSVETANAWAAEVSKKMLKAAKELDKIMSCHIPAAKNDEAVFFHYRGEVYGGEGIEKMGWYYWEFSEKDYCGPFRSYPLAMAALKQYLQENAN